MVVSVLNRISVIWSFHRSSNVSTGLFASAAALAVSTRTQRTSRKLVLPGRAFQGIKRLSPRARSRYLPSRPAKTRMKLIRNYRASPPRCQIVRWTAWRECRARTMEVTGSLASRFSGWRACPFGFFRWREVINGPFSSIFPRSFSFSLVH